MRPAQIHRAVANDLPLLIGCGVIEYHGPHLPVGTDYLIASSIVEATERSAPDHCVLAPGLPYGPTGEWAGGPEDGEVHLPPEPFFRYVKPILNAYLEMGFQRILVCQHHQGAEGPQQLCLRRAAAELTFDRARAKAGAGWGRPPKNQQPEAFGRIRVHSVTDFVEGEPLEIPWGHGSYGETEYIRSVFPDTVEINELSKMNSLPSWLENSHTADGNQGSEWFERCVDGWVNAVRASTEQ